MRRWLNGVRMAKLAVGLAAVGLLATAANAQGRMEARFSLPCETNWAGKTLPAGDYSLTVTSLAHTPYVRVDSLNGNGRVYIPSETVGEKSGDEDVIVLSQRSDRCVVRTMNLASIGEKFFYKVAPGAEMEASRQSQPERRGALSVKER